MIIKSEASLFRDYEAITQQAKERREPIFITHNGDGDMVLLPLELYEALSERKTLPPILKKAERIETKPERERTDSVSEMSLGLELKRLYETAPRGSSVSFIHLFGIYYAEEITANRLDKKLILRYAELPESYQTEISKGMNLAKYVTIKPGVMEG